MSPELVRTGDVWKDLDPRGGPKFRVVGVDAPLVTPRRVVVENLDGRYRRTVLYQRFRHHHAYRSGYGLVSREATP